MFFAMGYFRLETVAEFPDIRRTRDEMIMEQETWYVLREDADKFERDFFGLGKEESCKHPDQPVAHEGEVPEPTKNEEVSVPSPPSKRELRREAWAELEARALKMKGYDPNIRLNEIIDDPFQQLIFKKRGLDPPTAETIYTRLKGKIGTKKGRPRKSENKSG